MALTIFRIWAGPDLLRPDDAMVMVHRLQEIGVDEVSCLVDFGIEADTVLHGLTHLSTLKQAVEHEVEEAAARRSSADLMTMNGATHLQCTPSWARLLLADPAAPRPGPAPARA